MMDAFVVGATGLVGREVVATLCAQGLKTVAHVRADSPRLAEWQGRFGALGAQVAALPFESGAFTDALASHRPRLVFSLLGTTRKRMAQEGGDYQSIDFGLTRLLIDAVAVAGIARIHSDFRFVYLSSIGVKPGTRNAYLKARADAEAHLQTSGLPYTVARPSIILGERDEPRAGEAVAGAVAGGVLGLLGALGARTLRDRYTSTTAPILGAALVRCALDPQARNRILDGAALRIG